MIYLNYSNLDAETQQRLLFTSKEDIENKFGDDLKAYAQKYHLDYNTILEEETMRNLYNLKIKFAI